MSMKIETPPVLAGGTDAQLRQVYAYLYRLSEQLNIALDASAVPLPSAGGGAATAGADARWQQFGSTYNELRGLIVNTADIVRKEMDTVETRLQERYEAISGQWGTFREDISNTITETARGVLMEFDYSGAIDTLQAQAAGFESYRVTTEGYIHPGFLDYDENGVPILGIAVGQGLTTTSVTVDGEVYDRFDPNQNCAFYTADKVSFRINGQEVAYLSNRKLYIGDMEVSGRIALNSWLVTSKDDFVIRWIGGDGA